MSVWLTKRVRKYQVRTRGGVMIAHCFSLQGAREFWAEGRSRTIWKWDGKSYKQIA